VVVEPPAVDERAQFAYLWRLAGASDDVEEALTTIGMLIEHGPAVALPGAHHGVLAFYQQGRGSVGSSPPDGFRFNLGVEHECSGIGQGNRKAEGDGKAEVLGGKTQAQAFDVAWMLALDGHFTALHACAHLRPGPPGRIQSAFTGKCFDHAALGCFGEQAKGLVEIGFAATVGTRHEVELA